jgi:transposase-like protein
VVAAGNIRADNEGLEAAMLWHKRVWQTIEILRTSSGIDQKILGGTVVSQTSFVPNSRRQAMFHHIHVNAIIRDPVLLFRALRELPRRFGWRFSLGNRCCENPIGAGTAYALEGGFANLKSTPFENRRRMREDTNFREGFERFARKVYDPADVLLGRPVGVMAKFGILCGSVPAALMRQVQLTRATDKERRAYFQLDRVAPIPDPQVIQVELVKSCPHPRCGGQDCHLTHYGFTKDGTQRWKCERCERVVTAVHGPIYDLKKLPEKAKRQALQDRMSKAYKRGKSLRALAHHYHMSYSRVQRAMATAI